MVMGLCVCACVRACACVCVRACGRRTWEATTEAFDVTEEFRLEKHKSIQDTVRDERESESERERQRETERERTSPCISRYRIR